MNDSTNHPTVSFSLTYRNLHALFVAGFVLGAILYFVPAIKLNGFGGAIQTLSVLDLTRLMFQGNQFGAGLFMVVTFCANVTFAVLAVKYPRRWVFIAGACYAGFILALDFFAGSNKDVQYLFFVQLLNYVSGAMALTGFWVKPSTLPSTSEPTV